MPDAVVSDAALDVIAEALDSTGRYRVARRFESRRRYADADGSPTLRGVYVDTETTGPDTERDVVIELALLPFEYSPADGRIFEVGEALAYLEDPGRPILPEITALTGISDPDVAGRRIDDFEVKALLDGVRLVVAHNAAFDRPLLERRLPFFSKLPWACSYADVPWAKHGIAAAKLEFILFRHCGAFFEGHHRAEQDCHAGLFALATPFRSGELPFKLLLESSRRRTVRIWALDSPFESRHVLKARGWRWSPGDSGRPKSWYADVREEDFDAECAWLRDAVYPGRRTAPWRTRVFGALERYSARVGAP
jgi:DNA polymerase-3 subunit epsilon